MTLHYEDAGLRLFHGSNKDILPTFPDATFDSIVTDPPYELGFMGKSWDSTGIAYDVDLWRECLRVLKPGGYLLAFGGTRTWHRIAVAIEDAGFEIRDSIAWMYGSGFPKSMDVSKAIDKAAGAERAVVGVAGRSGSKRNVMAGDFAGGDYFETAAATPDAEIWQGWGTALKPAFEPIVVARKPLTGTVAANVLAYGTGALNIDACRVATTDKLGGGSETRGRQMNGGWDRPLMHDEEAVEASAAHARAQVEKAEALGRFPANVLLDESQATALDAQTDSEGASRFFPIFRYEGKAPGSERPSYVKDGAGEASPTSFRMKVRECSVCGSRTVPGGWIAGDPRPNPACGHDDWAWVAQKLGEDRVSHATVKPLELMRWLVRLVTRPGGRVLDPFAGSGTTGEAALLEGMEVDLIELEAEHLPLILQRVRKPLQPSMFGDWEDGVA